MNNKFLSLAAALLMLTSAQPAMSQLKLWTGSLPPSAETHKPMDAAQLEKLKSQYPAVYRLLTKGQNVKMPKVAASSPKAPVKATAAGNGSEIWANLINDKSWTMENHPTGLYSIYSYTANDFQELVSDQGDFDMNAGGAISNGKLDFMWAYFEGLSSGFIIARHYQYDTKTWKKTIDGKLVSLANVLAFAEATYNDTIYGQFIDNDLQSLDWGTIEYKTFKRPTLGTQKVQIAALGFTADGVGYGVGIDGNFYKINRADGAMTLIGSTGLQLVDAKGTLYYCGGTLDPKNGRFYLTVTDGNGTGSLYDVDLPTGKASVLYNYDNGQALTGMLLPDRSYDGSVPSRPDGLKATAEGVISFHAPIYTYSGAPLEGSLNYIVKLNGDTIANKETSAGQNVSLTTTIPEGMNDISVTVSNANGTSPERRLVRWFGDDQPVMQSVDFKVNDDKATTAIHWSKPTTSVHHGLLGKITYDVYRIINGDTTLIQSGLTDTTCTDKPVAARQTPLCYGVVAINGSQKSAMSVSPFHNFGPAFTVPFYDNFGDAATINNYTIINANNDKSTWEYYKYYKCVYCRPCYKGNADDWLCSPYIHLEAGKKYKVSFEWKFPYSSKKAEAIDVFVGQDQTVEAMTKMVMDTTFKYNATSLTAESQTLTVDNSGDYSIGIHFKSPQSTTGLYLYNLKVMEVIDSTSLAAVTDLEIKPSELGELKAEVSFKAPAKNLDGSAVTSIKKIEVIRDNYVVNTFSDVAAGQALSFTDSGIASNGKHAYFVVPYSAQGAGASVFENVFIGKDVPGVVTNINFDDQGDHIKFTWSPVPKVGANGGVVIPSEVSYTIKPEGDFPTLDVGNNTTGNWVVNTDSGTTQFQRYYIINAKTNEGKGSNASFAMIQGPAEQLPFEEHFKPYATVKFYKYYDALRNTFKFVKLNNDADGNDGCAELTAYKGDTVDVIMKSRKISLKGATNPNLVFSHYFKPGNMAALKIEVLKPNGVTEPLKTYDYTKLNYTEGWKQENVQLSKYVDERYVIIVFRGLLYAKDAKIDIDKVIVDDFVNNNIKVSTAVASRAERGDTLTLNVSVTNNGLNAASHYGMKVSGDNSEFVNITEPDTLGCYDVKDYEFKIPATLFEDNSDLMCLTTKVTLATDEDESDNVVNDTIKLYDSKVPPVESVKATSAGKQATVTWTAPASTKKEITEDFEEYVPWLIQFGDWTLTDGDKGKCQGLISQATYPNASKPFAFEIFNPLAYYAGIYDLVGNFEPHSGDQYAAAVASGDGFDGWPMDQDNWLISPKLSGEAQTITFWAQNSKRSTGVYAQENFDVLYSKGSSLTTSFVKIGDSHQLFNGQWTKVSVDLPAGATYFAIHHNTKASNGLMLKIDDVTFTQDFGSPVSYNVYKDRVFVGNVKADELLQLVDNDAEGNHEYAVTAIYANGKESLPVTAQTGSDGIDEVTDGKILPADIYTIDGKLVRENATDTDGLPAGIYIMNGQKVLVK